MLAYEITVSFLYERPLLFRWIGVGKLESEDIICIFQLLFV
jgi:hypothetical protein